MRNIFILLIVMASSLGAGRAQQSSNEAEVEIAPANEEGYRRDEIAIANLDALVNTTKDKAFIIAHLGRGETSRQLNRRRLACIKSLFGSGFKHGKVILAEGERVKGLARVDFYLGSELMHVALIARNDNICSGRWR